MSLTDAELDKKLHDLLKAMINRLPAEKKLSAAVVQQLLRTKYPSIYPEAYVVSREVFISDSIASLSAERGAAAPPTSNAAPQSEGSEDSDSDSDSDSGGSDSSNEEDEEDEEYDEGDEDSDSSDNDEESDDDEEDEEDGEADDGEAPEKKKARQEEEKALLERTTTTPGSSEGVAERCKAMVACLKKLGYRVRAPNADESLEDYLNAYLVEEFKKHKMDPNRYDKKDIKLYKIKREVELLQQDGASLNLDRRNRVGRGYAGVDASDGPAAPSAYKTSAFLDDEEE